MSLTISLDELVGTWHLIEFEVVVDGEVSSQPLGDRPVGQIMYGADGRMSALLMRRDRPWRDGVEFLRDASDTERAQAALDLVGYGGAYELGANRVVHRVEMALYPELVGTELVRDAAWDGRHLVLETEKVPTPSGRMRWQRLTWTKAPSADAR